jgi:MFS family permease
MERRPEQVGSRMAGFHILWALAFVAVFLATGMYMRARFPEMYQGDATMRMLFRSAHIYILFAALANLAIGSYLTPRSGWRAPLQVCSSLALIAAPVVFTGAFFFEPAPERLDRPISFCGVSLMSAAVLGHFIASRGE